MNASYELSALEYAIAHGGTVFRLLRKPASISQCGGGVGDGASWVDIHVDHWLSHCGTILGSKHVGVGSVLFFLERLLKVTTPPPVDVLLGYANSVYVDLYVPSMVSVAIGNRPFMIVSVVSIITV